MKIINRSIKKVINILGFDIIRFHNSPGLTLLGLRNININTIIDVGANEGQFIKYIRKFFPESYVYSFEPLPEAYKKLMSLAKMDGKIRIFNVALGEKEEEAEMFLHAEHTPSSSLLKTTHKANEYYPFTKTQKTVRTKIETLDGIVKKEGLDLKPEILVKIDTQGYEDRVIRGGNATMRRVKACIVEVNLDILYEKQANFKELVEMLYELGFKYAGNLEQAYARDGHVIYIDALFWR